MAGFASLGLLPRLGERGRYLARVFHPTSSMTRRDKLRLAAFVSSALLYFPLSEWVATAAYGTTLLLWLQLIYLFPLGGAILASPVLIVCLLFRRTRPDSFFYLIMSAVLLACCLIGFRIGNSIRMDRAHLIAKRGQELINAIKQYETDNSAPPPTLNTLVPNYIATVPTTGIMAYPEYDYHVGDDAIRRFCDNSWALSVDMPGAGNFDMMLYLPRGNYPRFGFGGSLESVDAWGYVHE